jgi:hypothetical protein
MTLLLARYLGVVFPFTLQFGPIPTARWNTNEDGTIALSLSESSVDLFVIGLSILNYNIAYLCHTQRISIPLDQTHETLEMLAKCCSSSELGKQNTVEPFEMELEHVIEHHRAMTHTKPWEMLHMDEDGGSDQWDVIDDGEL